MSRLASPKASAWRDEVRRLAACRGIKIHKVDGGHRLVGGGIDFLVCDLYWVAEQDLDHQMVYRFTPI